MTTKILIFKDSTGDLNTQNSTFGFYQEGLYWLDRSKYSRIPKGYSQVSISPTLNINSVPDWGIDNIQEVHSQLVLDLAKSGQDIIDSLTPNKAHLWHMATGLSGEAGEVLEKIKKHVIYGKELDVEGLIEELGDAEFYFRGVVQGLQELGCTLDRDEILDGNITKLNKRYESGSFSNKQANERADKTEPKVVHHEI